jgi:hypothetical protein
VPWATFSSPTEGNFCHKEHQQFIYLHGSLFTWLIIWLVKFTTWHKGVFQTFVYHNCKETTSSTGPPGVPVFPRLPWGWSDTSPTPTQPRDGPQGQGCFLSTDIFRELSFGTSLETCSSGTQPLSSGRKSVEEKGPHPGKVSTGEQGCRVGQGRGWGGEP